MENDQTPIQAATIAKVLLEDFEAIVKEAEIKIRYLLRENEDLLIENKALKTALQRQYKD